MFSPSGYSLPLLFLMWGYFNIKGGKGKFAVHLASVGDTSFIIPI